MKRARYVHLIQTTTTNTTIQQILAWGSSFMHAPHIHKPETSSSSSKLLKTVSHKALVVMTSEYCTTKTCNRCGKQNMKLMQGGVGVSIRGQEDEQQQEQQVKVRIFKRLVRDVQHCKECKITVNRDLNAAKNIAQKLLKLCIAP